MSVIQLVLIFCGWVTDVNMGVKWVFIKGTKLKGRGMGKMYFLVENMGYFY